MNRWYSRKRTPVLKWIDKMDEKMPGSKAVRDARRQELGYMDEAELLRRLDAFNRQVGYAVAGAMQNLIPLAVEAHSRGLV